MNINTLCYKVRSDHKFHSNRIGKFEFIGGPQHNIIVLSNPQDLRELFAVNVDDVDIFVLPPAKNLT